MDYEASHWADIGATEIVIILAVMALQIAAMWKIFTKAGKPGWAAMVPIYNIVVWLEIIGRPIWWIFLYLIPIVNIVITIIMTHDLSKSFDKDFGFTLGLLFLSLIFYPILGFGSAKYIGPSAARPAANALSGM